MSPPAGYTYTTGTTLQRMSPGSPEGSWWYDLGGVVLGHLGGSGGSV